MHPHHVSSTVSNQTGGASAGFTPFASGSYEEELKMGDGQAAMERLLSKGGASADFTPFASGSYEEELKMGDGQAAMERLLSKGASKEITIDKEAAWNHAVKLSGHHKLNHYLVLRASRTASTKEIKANYSRLMRQLHPDKLKLSLKDLPEQEREKQEAIACKAVSMLNEAWEVLQDAERRREYDFELNDASEERAEDAEEDEDDPKDCGNGIIPDGYLGDAALRDELRPTTALVEEALERSLGAAPPPIATADAKKSTKDDRKFSCTEPGCVFASKTDDVLASHIAVRHGAFPKRKATILKALNTTSVSAHLLRVAEAGGENDLPSTPNNHCALPNGARVPNEDNLRRIAEALCRHNGGRGDDVVMEEDLPQEWADGIGTAISALMTMGADAERRAEPMLAFPDPARVAVSMASLDSAVTGDRLRFGPSSHELKNSDKIGDLVPVVDLSALPEILREAVGQDVKRVPIVQLPFVPGVKKPQDACPCGSGFWFGMRQTHCRSCGVRFCSGCVNFSTGGTLVLPQLGLTSHKHPACKVCVSKAKEDVRAAVRDACASRICNESMGLHDRLRAAEVYSAIFKPTAQQWQVIMEKVIMEKNLPWSLRLFILEQSSRIIENETLQTLAMQHLMEIPDLNARHNALMLTFWRFGRLGVGRELCLALLQDPASLHGQGQSDLGTVMAFVSTCAGPINNPALILSKAQKCLEEKMPHFIAAAAAVAVACRNKKAPAGLRPAAIIRASNASGYVKDVLTLLVSVSPHVSSPRAWVEAAASLSQGRWKKLLGLLFSALSDRDRSQFLEEARAQHLHRLVEWHMQFHGDFRSSAWLALAADCACSSTTPLGAEELAIMRRSLRRCAGFHFEKTGGESLDWAALARTSAQPADPLGGTKALLCLLQSVCQTSAGERGGCHEEDRGLRTWQHVAATLADMQAPSLELVARKASDPRFDLHAFLQDKVTQKEVDSKDTASRSRLVFFHALLVHLTDPERTASEPQPAKNRKNYMHVQHALGLAKELRATGRCALAAEVLALITREGGPAESSRKVYQARLALARCLEDLHEPPPVIYGAFVYAAAASEQRTKDLQQRLQHWDRKLREERRMNRVAAALPLLHICYDANLYSLALIAAFDCDDAFTLEAFAIEYSQQLAEYKAVPRQLRAILILARGVVAVLHGACAEGAALLQAALALNPNEYYTRVVAHVMADPVARVGGLLDMRRSLTVFATLEELLASAWLDPAASPPSEQELSIGAEENLEDPAAAAAASEGQEEDVDRRETRLPSEFITPKDIFPVQTKRILRSLRHYELAIAHERQESGHLEAALMYFNASVHVAIDSFSKAGCMLQAVRHLLAAVREAEKTPEGEEAAFVALRIGQALLDLVVYLSSHVDLISRTHVLRAAAALRLHGMATAARWFPVANTPRHVSQAAATLHQLVRLARIFPVSARAPVRAYDTMLLGLASCALGKQVLLRLDDRLVMLLPREEWACLKLEGVWHGWMSRDSDGNQEDDEASEDSDHNDHGDEARQETTKGTAKKSAARGGDGDGDNGGRQGGVGGGWWPWSRITHGRSTQPAGGASMSASKQVDVFVEDAGSDEDMETPQQRKERLAREKRARREKRERRMDAEFFAKTRLETMEEVLKSGGEPDPWRSCASFLDILKLPRDEQGFLDMPAVRQQAANCFRLHSFDGFRFDKKSGEVQFRVTLADPSQTGLF
eukprot:g77342.t1